MIRDDIKTATITAMKAKDSVRLGTLRLISAALKNKDIELRTGVAPTDDDVLVADVLSKMAKQRRESIDMFVTGGRPELADADLVATLHRAHQRRLDVVANHLALASQDRKNPVVAAKSRRLQR